MRSQLCSSVIRLAGIARHSGRAADAVSELWPLITRLETRVAAGHAEAETMRLLAQARVSFGVALGHLLPEERLATAARWTGRALRIAWNLGDRDLLASVLRMHGNELRKAGHAAAGIIRIRQSLQIDDHPARKGSGLVLLARAAAEPTPSRTTRSPRSRSRSRCSQVLSSRLADDRAGGHPGYLPADGRRGGEVRYRDSAAHRPVRGPGADLDPLDR